MKQIRDIYKKTGNLHHAYGLFGERLKIKKELTDFLIKDFKFPLANNPDFWQGDFNVFKINDSRMINEIHLNRPVKYSRKFFIISANFITKDAQNSLLKIFEEPKADTTFFLILPEGTELLSTLKSRLIIIKEKMAVDGEWLAEDFLGFKIGKRLEIIAKIIKDIKDEKQTKSDAITFMKNLEQAIKKKRFPAKKRLSAIEDLEKAISYAGDESPSVRVILEHLALVL
jgi:DNA polymerase III delta prime subunit